MSKQKKSDAIAVRTIVHAVKAAIYQMAVEGARIKWLRRQRHAVVK